MGLCSRFLIPGVFLCLLMALCPLNAVPEKMTEEQLNELLSSLETNLSGLKTLAATFEQQKHIALFDESLKADGRLLFESPGKIRFEISAPFKSTLIVAGKEVAKYEQTEGDWKRLKLKNADAVALVMKQIGDWMNGKFRKQGRLFELSAQHDAEKTVLILSSKPKEFAKVIKQIEIAIAPDRTRFHSITIRENGGDHTILKFVGDDRTQTFPEGTFDTARLVPLAVETGSSK